MALIGKRAAVSKSDFYKHFESKDDCFIAAYDAAIELITARVVEACARHRDGQWQAQVRDAIASLLALLSAEPALASISLVEGLRAGPNIYDRYQAALETFVGYLREGAPQAAAGEPVPAATDEAVVGGIASLLGRRVVAGEAEQIELLLPEILEFALTPYMGAEEARRIASAG